ncbi:MAG TPA: tryptophan-rich sensory protein [Dehalococcoidia bacterium]|nr:tryptophan-rich sensory protein [Dehalococcoidia bacterium]
MPANKRFKDIVRLIISIVACQCAGIVGSVFTTRTIPTWYAALQKPPFTPPNWLFAPAWITLYLLMGISAFLVWRTGLENRETRRALVVFLVQLVLNALWSIAFFGLQSPLYGLIAIIALWIAILLTILKFFRISTIAGSIMLPYILWVTFAAVLNASIFTLNP